MKYLLILFFVTSVTFGQVSRASGSGGISEGEVQALIDASLSSVNVLATDKTVNLTSAMTLANIQDSIDAQPKNLGGNALTFQFADGTYSYSNSINFSYFYNGIVTVHGNATDNTNTKTKSVILDFSHTGFGIHAFRLQAQLIIRYLRVEYFAGSGILVEKSMDAFVQHCYFVGANNTNCTSLQFSSVNLGRSYNCTYGFSLYGIYNLTGGQALLNDNLDGTAGDRPAYGIVASDVCEMVNMGTLITGTTSNSATLNGGEIR